MFDSKTLALAALAGAASCEAFTASPSSLPTRSAAVQACTTPSLALRMQTNDGSNMELSRRAVFAAGAAGAASWLFSGVAPALAKSDWIEVEDPKTGKPYWYNSVTQKTTWANPDEVAAAPAKDAAGAAGADEEEAGAGGKKKTDRRMGGLLEPFRDINKGFQVMKPRGWNQFDAAPGEYDVKWEDLVEKSEMVMVGTKEVKTAKSVDALGNVQELGKKLATKKKAELVSAEEREEDGIKYYKFVFKQGDVKVGAREVFQLCVNKGRLWSVTATTTEKRWAKREKFYDNVMGSFIPKL
mmetsp:Transcript_37648/g.73571  ORF Transcript_37648/g.73571 Transcript_37648/m.73571 type:complete len:298 (-) Transcript_37648:60-953(-)|eukprot:CAMPEP_0173380160 /NCGR_PEP_ID=MMETSP1356-20130122/2897_1 /TAXON_ID=77927 ORGANISM="Hemiselmis virescens, Strain PCC157" /NCGR_SAMPLE_ID=MMETSP1356 /ASSEMBLY_ACC=CAM_ASM_000847 /LENGTH=297 /DNA_ID=CAMNT_0014333661 /DNA_START=56 /DNA_END=949 /DNA_ORIENTATION=+